MAVRDGWKSAGWMATWLIAALLFLTGLQKFIDDGQWERDFVRWGYPAWMTFAIGAIEMGAAVAFAVPKTSAHGGAILAGTMVGATLTRAFDGTWGPAVFTLFLAAACGYLAFIRRPNWSLRLLPR